MSLGRGTDSYRVLGCRACSGCCEGKLRWMSRGWRASAPTPAWRWPKQPCETRWRPSAGTAGFSAPPAWCTGEHLRLVAAAESRSRSTSESRPLSCRHFSTPVNISFSLGGQLAFFLRPSREITLKSLTPSPQSILFYFVSTSHFRWSDEENSALLFFSMKNQ